MFETQAALLSCRSVSEFDSLTANARRWLQPRHFAEIVEERSTENVCGYPPCAKHLEYCASLPSSGSVTLRISYKEKRLYEVDSSIKFCSKECLKLAAAFEASLDDTNPEGREGAVEFAVKYDSSDIAESVLQGTRRASPPTFHNDTLEVSGAVKKTGDTISAIASALQSLKRDKVSYKTSSADGNAKPGSFGSIGAVPAFRFLPSTGRTPPILAYGPMNGDPLSSKTTEMQPTIEAEVQTEDASSGGPAAHAGLLPQAPSEQRESVRPKREGVSPGEDRLAKSGAAKVLSRVMNALVVETDRASPATKGAAVDERSPVEGILPLVSPLTHAREPHSSSRTDASTSDITSLVKRITFSDATIDPAAVDRNSRSLVNVENAIDNSHEYPNDPDTSLFMLLWTALDDLFGNERCTSTLLSPNGEADGDVTSGAATQPVADPTQLAQRRSIGQFVERGFSIAESHLRPDTFLSETSHTRYLTTKATFLGYANLDVPCPSLSGREWALLSLLIVDAIVCGKQLIAKDDGAAWQAWKTEIESSVATITRTLSGRTRQSVRSLRDGDFVLLQSFFPRIVG